LANDHPLIERRRILVAAIEEITATAADEQKHHRNPEPYLIEATRLVLRLRALQEEIEKHDLD
jgi:hypothetical protein